MNNVLLKLNKNAGLRRGLLSMAMFLTINMGAQAQDTGAGVDTAAGGPTIRGNVFGGGRMANVSNTATPTVADANKVTATIDVYASTIEKGVFGGNDITGTVAQATGDGYASSKITIHDACDAVCSVQEVYGGGNGYYKYKIGETVIDITDANKNTQVAANTLVEVLDTSGNKVAEFYTSASAATTYADLLPVLSNTSVIIGEATGAKDKIALNEVYGGAKNAYVTDTSSVTVESGTIGKVFAGNNYGGSIASTLLTINGTKKPETEPTSADFVTFDWSKAGAWDDVEGNGFGIGEAYGGGNAVDVLNGASVYMNGGYVKTLFGGNNLAVFSGATDVYLKGGMTHTAYGGGNKGNVVISNIRIIDNATVGTAFAGGNAATVTTSANLYLDCDGARSNSSDYVTDDTKTPNVGTIFGGNNLADMYIVPWMELHRGSVKTVYGGGNKGNMCGHDALFVDGSKIINPSVFTGSYPTFAADKVLLFAATDVMIDSKYGKDASGNDVPDDGLIVGEVYGGCRQANVNNSSYVRLTHAQYIGNVYGGCDISGSVGFNPGTLTEGMLTDGKLQVFSTNGVNGTEGVAVADSFVGKPLYNASTFVYMTGGTVSGNIYGGGNGNYNYASNMVEGEETNAYAGLSAPFVAATTVNIEKGTIKGNLYGGGNKADVGYVYPEAGSYMGKTYAAGDILTNMSYIYLGHGEETTSVKVEGSVYGGCRNANVYGAIDILALKDVQINKLFAGNDISGSIKGNWRGTRFSLENMAMTSLIGTGTDATSRAKDKLSFAGETLTGENANVYVRVMPGARITSLYGGSNGDYGSKDADGKYASGEYAGQPKPVMHSTLLDVAGNVDNVYGGGNAADIYNTHVCIYGTAAVGTSTNAGAVYGGCKSADVTHAANVLMVGNGTVSPTVYGNVFGGCDISGNVGDCTLACRDEHGAKNENAHLSDEAEPTDATVAGYSFVKILGGKVTDRVFGGGNGLQSADGTAYYTRAPVSEGTAPFDVYKYPEGSDYAGKQLPVCQNTYVLVKNATIGTTESTSEAEIHSCFGGGQGAGTKVMHNAYTALGTANADDKTLVNGILYGGSYAGFVNSTCEDVTRTVLLGYGNTTSVKGDVYGGSYGNYVRGTIDLNINNISLGAGEGQFAAVYSGNNAAAQPECNACINYVGYDCNVVLYGGGNHADFYGTTRITFTKGDIGYIYGGGNNADVYGNTIVEVLGGHVCHDVFGGGNNGNVKVWNTSAEHPVPQGVNSYGGNTLVIVRDDCLQVDADSKLKVDATTGNYSANRDDTKFYSTYFNGNDPYAKEMQLYVLKPNDETAPTRSKITIEGNVFGGGNNADVEGKATVIIGDQAN